MDVIRLKKKNEAFLYVECERSIEKELSEYFSFFVPGYQFMPAYKNKLWSGKINLHNLNTHEIYYGLVPYIQKFCEERNYKCIVESNVNTTENYSLVEAQQFIETLKLPFEVRDYQLNSFVHAIRNRRILLLSPTSSGKSLIIYLIMRLLQDAGMKKGILIVPTTSLCYQMYEDFKSYSKNDDSFNVEDEVSIIMAGKDKNPKKERIKITFENNVSKLLKPNQKIKTKKGIKLAKDLNIDDEIL